MTIEQINQQIKEGKTRFCKKCSNDLPVSEFHIRYDKNENHIRFNSPCKKCSYENRNILHRKSHYRKVKYNITDTEYDDKLKEQNYSCSICKIQRKDCVKDFAIDHCHVTNNVRGLLCNNCNSGIGFLKDDISILLSAIEYLNKYKQ